MTDPLEPFHRAKYMNLTSYRRDGSAVPTTVWFALIDGRLFMRTDSKSYKVTRMRNNPSVTVAPSNSRGDVKSHAVPGRAEEVEASEGKRVAKAYLRRYPIGYGWEIAVLRPLHALLARIHIGRRRGKAVFFEIVVGRVLLALPALHVPELVAF